MFPSLQVALSEVAADAAAAAEPTPSPPASRLYSLTDVPPAEVCTCTLYPSTSTFAWNLGTSCLSVGARAQLYLPLLNFYLTPTSAGVFLIRSHDSWPRWRAPCPRWLASRSDSRCSWASEIARWPRPSTRSASRSWTSPTSRSSSTASSVRTLSYRLELLVLLLYSPSHYCEFVMFDCYCLFLICTCRQLRLRGRLRPRLLAWDCRLQSGHHSSSDCRLDLRACGGRRRSPTLFTVLIGYNRVSQI